MTLLSEKNDSFINVELSNEERLIDLAGNPNYKVEKDLENWIDENNVNLEHETDYTNKYNQWGSIKETALLRAIRSGNLDLVTLLIRKGVDINHSRPSDNCTPLMLSVYYIPVLSNSMFSEGEIIDDYSENGLKITNLLIEAGADLDKGTLLHYWTGRTDNSTFDYIVENIKNVNVLSQTDNSNLFTSTLIKNISLKNYIKLHKKGVDINSVNDHNHNPFFNAAGCDRLDIVDYLLNFDVDFNIVSKPYKKNIFQYLESKNNFETLYKLHKLLAKKKNVILFED